MNRQEFLGRASDLISSNRNLNYGEPERNFERISLFWQVYLSERAEQEPNFTEVKPHDVGIMMALLKIARLMESPYNEDSWADAIGYLACSAELAMQQEDESSPDASEISAIMEQLFAPLSNVSVSPQDVDFHGERFGGENS